MAYKILTHVTLIENATGEHVPSNDYIVRCSARGFKQDVSDKSITVSPGYNLIVIEALNDYRGQIDKVIEAYIDPSKSKVNAIEDQTYTGELIVPHIDLKSNNETILQSYPAKTIYFPNEDDCIIKKEFPEYACYALEYSNNRDVGTACIHILPTHVGDGVASKDIYFQITPYSITGSKVSITGIQTIEYYRGHTVEQDGIILKFNGKTLNRDTDYIVQYFDNDKLGNASFDIIGKGNFSGTISKTFSIYGNINDATIAAIPDFEYDGTTLMPSSLDVVWYGHSLAEGTDYSIEYPSGSNFILPGIKTGHLYGIESAWMKDTKDFTYQIFGNIDQVQFFGQRNSYKHTGQQIKPEIDVIFHGMILSKSLDYEIAYPSLDYTTVGEKTIQVIGKNSYRGIKSLTYRIYDSEQNTIAYRKDGTSFTVASNNLTRQSFGIAGKKDSTLTKVVFGSNVTSLEKELFSHCTQLKNVNMRSCSSSVELPEGMFDGCIRLQNVVFPQQEYSQDYTLCTWAKGNRGFIDTGYVPTKDTVIGFTIRHNGDYSSSTYVGFNAVGVDPSIHANYRFYVESQNKIVLEIANHQWIWSDTTPIFKPDTDYSIKLSYDGLYVNGIQRGTLYVNGSNTVILKHPICIFGQEDSSVNFSIKTVKVSNGSRTVLNLAPAIDYDKVGCLVDLISGTKFYSANGIDIDCFNSIPTMSNCEVEFDAGDGEIDGPAIKIIERGKTLGSIPNATRIGYELTGFVNASTGAKATTTTMITQDTVFIARWKLLTTVKYTTGEVSSFSISTPLDKTLIANSDSITELSIGEAVPSLRKEAFSGCSQLKNAVILSNITVIPVQAFSNCVNLSSISFPNTITTIDINAFRRCFRLSTIVLPQSLETIGNWAFYDCNQLTEIGIDKLDNIASIGCGAFNGCSSIVSVSWPSSIKHIPEKAFYDCTNLSSIDLPITVTSIGKYAFFNAGLISVHIPTSLTSVADRGFACPHLTGVYVDDPLALASISFINKTSNPLWYAHNLYSTNGNLITSLTFNNTPIIKEYAYNYCSSIQRLQVIGSQSNIEECAFANCRCLQEALIPAVNIIGKNAFSYCTSLSTIEFGEDVRSIDISAFASTGISRLDVNSTNLSAIYSFAFENCYNLTSASFGDTIAKLHIWRGAFDKCSELTGIRIGKGVDYIYTTNQIAVGQAGFVNIGIFRGCSSLVSVVLPFIGESPTPYNTANNNFGKVFGSYDAQLSSGMTAITQHVSIYNIPKSLRDVVILGNGSYAVPYDAFQHLDMISSIQFGDGVTTLNYSAVNSLKNLQRITLASTISAIDQHAFIRPQPSLTCVAFEGRTIEDVKALKNYPFNIEDESIISCELTS